MKNCLVILILFSSFVSFAQKDTITYYTDIDLKSTEPEKAKFIFKVYQLDSANWIFSLFNEKNVIQQKETYSDSLLQIKQGPFVEYTSGKPSLKGTFFNNLKQGNFISYDSSGVVVEVSVYNLDTLKKRSIYWENGNIQEEKLYTQDMTLQTKTVFYNNGSLAIKEVYGIKNKLIESKYLNIEGKSVKAADIESPPLFPGGIDKFYEFLGYKMKYPPQAAEANIQGSVFVSFTITSTGEVKNVKVDRKLHPLLDMEAERVVKLSPKWIPGKLFGKAVNVKYNLPIRFNLERKY